MKTMSNFMLCREIIFVKKTYIFFASGTIEELVNGDEEVGMTITEYKIVRIYQ